MSGIQNEGIGRGITVYNANGTASVYIENFSGSLPSNSFGSDGDYAIDITTWEVALKSAGTWAQTGLSSRVSGATAGIRFRTPNLTAVTSTDVSGFSGLTNTVDGQSITFIAGNKVLSTFDNNIYTVAVGAWTLASYSPALADNDAFFVNNVYSDTVQQRGGAIFQRQSGVWVKIADLDFETAASIGFLSYSPPASGAVTDVAGSDSVQDAIGKLDTSVDNLIAQIGVARTDTNIGTLNGLSVINQTVKATIQTIIDRTRYETSASNVTTAVTLDSVLVANIKTVEWIVQAAATGDSTKWYSSRILAVSDGTNGNTSNNETNIVRSNGGITGLSFTVDVSGTDLRLRVSSTSAVNVKAIRKVIA